MVSRQNYCRYGHINMPNIDFISGSSAETRLTVYRGFAPRPRNIKNIIMYVFNCRLCSNQCCGDLSPKLCWLNYRNCVQQCLLQWFVATFILATNAPLCVWKDVVMICRLNVVGDKSSVVLSNVYDGDLQAQISLATIWPFIHEHNLFSKSIL